MDSPGRSILGRLILLSLLLVLPAGAFGQDVSSAPARIADLKALYDSGRWESVVQLAPESPENPPEVELYRGLALAQLQRWADARKAFETGFAESPRDPRFLEELAGIDYKEKQFSLAKHHLRHALALEPHDDYAINFLASIYFLEDNLEAALKYWNQLGKPKLADLTFDPQPTLNPLILDRAFAFSREAEWRRDQFLRTQAQLDCLDLFPRMRFDLEAQTDGSFDLGFHAQERNGWGMNWWEGLSSLLRGLPYKSVYPELYNLEHEGMNWISLIRWDDQKRRVSTEIAAPFRASPEIRYRLYFDGRNENWNITHTIVPSLPSPAGMNMEKAVAGAEIQSIVSGRWQWNVGVEYSYRQFRNLIGISDQAGSFFKDGSAIALRSTVARSLVRFPERRLTLDSSATAEIGTFFGNSPSGRYGRIQGSLGANWLPKGQGEDYEMQGRLRAGSTFGEVPFDELFMLGFDRDNDLWLRGHNGLRHGEKGSAPLGRNYVLANWEMDKILYKDGIFTVKIGPFLDTGDIYDPSGLFGSPKWLWDTGIQAKIRILGSFEFVLGYGKDLRSGNNSFFTTVSR